MGRFKGKEILRSNSDGSNESNSNFGTDCAPSKEDCSECEREDELSGAGERLWKSPSIEGKGSEGRGSDWNFGSSDGRGGESFYSSGSSD